VLKADAGWVRLMLRRGPVRWWRFRRRCAADFSGRRGGLRSGWLGSRRSGRSWWRGCGPPRRGRFARGTGRRLGPGRARIGGEALEGTVRAAASGEGGAQGRAGCRGWRRTWATWPRGARRPSDAGNKKPVAPGDGLKRAAGAVRRVPGGKRRAWRGGGGGAWLAATDGGGSACGRVCR